MMIMMQPGASQQHISRIVARAESLRLPVQLSRKDGRTTIAVVLQGNDYLFEEFAGMDGVAEARPISNPYKLTSREFQPNDSVVSFNGTSVGGGKLVVIAGPCSVESREQIIETAQAVKEAGADALRGGAYKPRTSPYSFQGLGEEGLEYMAEARELTGLPIVTEVMAPETMPIVSKYADVLQIGARNMQNYALLHAAGESHKPVLLKRGMSSTIKEWLMAAEYILSHGNRRVMLCERGIRTFETSTRNTTDINAVPVLKAQTHLPVIVDPSHSTGHWEYVAAIARAGVAAGADGLIVEVHTHPEVALSDGPQSLKPEKFATMVRQVRALGKALAVG